MTIRERLFPTKKPHIVFIHGANATSRSFSFIISELELSSKDYTLVDYNSASGFYCNLASMKEQLKDLSDFFIIAHSLGGIYAEHLCKTFNVVGGVTLSTPYRGSRTADWAKMFVPQYKLFHDCGVNSAPIVEGLKIKLPEQWTQIVTTAGHVPWHWGENDGVVTVKSMTHRKEIEHHFFNFTHYEVLGSIEVVGIISKELKSCTKT